MQGLNFWHITYCQFNEIFHIYNNILEYINNREEAILHPTKDMDIVRPNDQLDMVCVFQCNLFITTDVVLNTT